MRKAMFWIGILLLFVVFPTVIGIQGYLLKAVPPMQPWMYVTLLAGALLIYFGRNKDDVFKHHIA